MKRRKLKSSDRIGFRLPETMREQIRIIADADECSEASVVKRILKKNLSKELAKVS